MKAAESLAAVDGVVIPSKVLPGESPHQGNWEENEHTVYPCSICARKFKQKIHVKSHMTACVKRNGNPNGVRWDDAWRNVVSQAGSASAQPR